MANIPPAASTQSPLALSAVPVPDPTARTVEQMKGEIAASREIAEAKLNGVTAVFEERFNGMDKAIRILQDITDRLPDHIKDEVTQLRELTNERFNSFGEQLRNFGVGVQTQFIERDKRTEQLSLADKTAIAAALQAQKEAAGATNESNSVALTKMENNFTKLIEQGQTLLANGFRNVDEKINDIKGRLDRGEGMSGVRDPALSTQLTALTLAVAELKATRDLTTGHSKGIADGWGVIVGVIGILIAIASISILALSNWIKLTH